MEIPFSFLNRITSATVMGVSDIPQTSLTPSSVDSSNQYLSPYRLVFDFSWADLTAGFNQTPYNQWTSEGNSEPSSWYDYAAYAKNPDAGQSIGDQNLIYFLL